MLRPLFVPHSLPPTYVSLCLGTEEREASRTVADDAAGSPDDRQEHAPEARPKRAEVRKADAKFPPPVENTFEDWLRASEKFDIGALATREEKEKLNKMVNGKRGGGLVPPTMGRYELLVCAAVAALVCYTCHASHRPPTRSSPRPLNVSQRSAVEDLLGL